MEVSDQLHVLATLPSKENMPGTHWMGNYVGPTAGLDMASNSSVGMTCYGMDKWGKTPSKSSDFSLCQHIQAISVFHLVFPLLGTGAHSPGIKWLEDKTDHSPLSIAEV
jgi:hypothetical protein